MACERRVRALHELRRGQMAVAEQGEIGTVLDEVDTGVPSLVVAFDGPRSYTPDLGVGFTPTVPEAWVEDATEGRRAAQPQQT